MIELIIPVAYILAGIITLVFVLKYENDDEEIEVPVAILFIVFFPIVILYYTFAIKIKNPFYKKEKKK